MSKSKIAVIVGIILITVGIIGVIPSGMNMTKAVLLDISNARGKNTASNIVVGQERKEIENLKITSKNEDYDSLNIIVKKSNDDTFSIKKQTSFLDDVNVTYQYDESSKTIAVDTSSKRNNYNFNIVKEGILKSLYEEAISTIANGRSMGNNYIEIYVPNRVNIDVDRNSDTSLTITDEEVLGDSLNYNVSYGDISLPKFNQCKNININSSNHVILDVREFVNAEKVNIVGNYVSIHSNGKFTDYNEIDKLPEEINITAGDLYINSYIPMANKIILDVNSELNFHMPFNDYNIYGDITAKSDDLTLVDVNGKVENGRFKGELSTGDRGKVELIIKSCDYGEIRNVSRSNLEFDMD
ncbi:hypothetical protein KQI30_14205 [Clostridium bornimense]|uniref:hypothetical protein n=1 Tax=Clostridium bornimense TaxID=1216932 RepID=UPI001C0FAA2E|nr:hypothetical protein [Clostridium bornimense]MBU5317406.1 hypothetical protein [Clostridium bornimense]